MKPCSEWLDCDFVLYVTVMAQSILGFLERVCVVPTSATNVLGARGVWEIQGARASSRTRDRNRARGQ